MALQCSNGHSLEGCPTPFYFTLWAVCICQLPVRSKELTALSSLPIAGYNTSDGF